MEPDRKPLLAVSHLRAYYKTELYGISRTVRAVDGVTFNLYPNEVYGVAGESSCDKTTLIKVISGNIRNPLRIQSGSVRFYRRRRRPRHAVDHP